jgi:hypothetical protein
MLCLRRCRSQDQDGFDQGFDDFGEIDVDDDRVQIDGKGLQPAAGCCWRLSESRSVASVTKPAGGRSLALAGFMHIICPFAYERIRTGTFARSRTDGRLDNLEKGHDRWLESKETFGDKNATGPKTLSVSRVQSN